MAIILKVKAKANTGVSAPAAPLPAMFLSIRKAAVYAGVSEPTIRRWIKANMLRHYRAGKQIRIDPKDLVAFMVRDDHG